MDERRKVAVGLWIQQLWMWSDRRWRGLQRGVRRRGRALVDEGDVGPGSWLGDLRVYARRGRRSWPKVDKLIRWAVVDRPMNGNNVCYAAVVPGMGRRKNRQPVWSTGGMRRRRRMGGLERRPLVSWSVSVVVEDGMRVDVGGKAGGRMPGGGRWVVGWLCLRHLRKEGDEFSAWMTWYCRQAGLVKNIWMNRQRLLNNR